MCPLSDNDPPGFREPSHQDYVDEVEFIKLTTFLSHLSCISNEIRHQFDMDLLNYTKDRNPI